MNQGVKPDREFKKFPKGKDLITREFSLLGKFKETRFKIIIKITTKF